MARGIAARTKGTQFYNDETNETITLKGSVFLPKHDSSCEQEYEYHSHERLMAELDYIKTEFHDVPMHIYGARNSSMRAAMVSLWGRQDGSDVLYVRTAKSLSNSQSCPVKWSSKDFKENTGFHNTDSRSRAQTMVIKPHQLLPEGTNEISVQDVPDLLNDCATQAPGKDEKRILATGLRLVRGFMTGDFDHISIEPGDEQAIRQYLGEWLAPIALHTGHGIRSNIYDNYLDQRFNGASWKDFNTIRFNMTNSDGLIDSSLIAGNHEVLISSKAQKNGGAAASLASLGRILNSPTPAVLQTIERYPDIHNFVMNTIQNKGFNSVLSTAQNLGLVNSYEASTILENLSAGHLDDEHMLTNNLRENILPAWPLMQATICTQKKNPDYNMYCRIYSGLIIRIQEYYNRNDDFSNYMKEILSAGDMLQVYAKDSWHNGLYSINQMNVICPKNYSGVVKLNSDKLLSSIRHNSSTLCFKITKPC